MKLHSHSLRVLHRWIGLIIGLQFVLWAGSGAMMAVLDMEEVAGGPRPKPEQSRVTEVDRWPLIQAQLGSEPVQALSIRPLPGGQVYEIRTPDGIRLFDAETGRLVTINAALASQVARDAYPGSAPVKAVHSLREVTLAVRNHELPIWRVDFADEKNSSFYVSGATGALLERRNDSWRLWDFFWMLHNMDYVNRTSFNHPLIIIVGFAAVWLAISGVYLLFRTGWRSG